MKIMSHVCLAAVVAAIHLVFSGAGAFGAGSLVVNGDFQKWTGGVPDGWEVEIGATNGAAAPKSEVKRIKGPALMLRGGASTMAWHTVSQQIAARAGSSYRLEFVSRTKNIKREGRQFNNCYVGVTFLDKAGKVAARESQDVSADTADWEKHHIEFAVPQDAASTRVTIFLSKTGILAVKNVSVTAARLVSGTSAKPATDSETDADGLVTNGDFRKWTDALPDGWTVDIGATNGANEPTSEITRLGNAGLALRGSASTLAWHSLSQKLPLEKDKTYTLAFEAQAKDIRRQGRQFNNCYVGVMSSDANGKRVDMSIEDLSRVSRWKKQRIDFRVPPTAVETNVLIFLSKSGTLMVKNVSVKEATPDRPFRRSRR